MSSEAKEPGWPRACATLRAGKPARAAQQWLQEQRAERDLLLRELLHTQELLEFSIRERRTLGEQVARLETLNQMPRPTVLNVEQLGLVERFKLRFGNGVARQVNLVRCSGFFDVEFYLSENPDVAAARLDPVEHYFEHGAREGRLPNQRFATHWYLENYPDVASRGFNPLFHYTLWGMAEKRIPAPGCQPGEDIGVHLQAARRLRQELIERSALFEATSQRLAQLRRALARKGLPRTGAPATNGGRMSLLRRG